MTPPPDLQTLIALVEADAPETSALARLRAAAQMAETVAETTDAALGYFVDQARRNGHSWSEIGEALGVSKQAAQQRQARTGAVLTGVTFERFTGRARNVVTRAESVAKDLKHNYVGTEHLLLAQFSEPEAIAAQVLGELGVTEDQVRAAVRREIGEGPFRPEGDLAFTPRAAAVLRGALIVALEMGHNYIGTEHLLLGTARSDGLAQQILRALGVTETEVTPKVKARLAGLHPPAAPSPPPPAAATKAPAKRAARKKT